MQEFITAAEDADRDEDENTEYRFKIDGRECIAYRPQPGQLAVLLATNARHSSEEEQIAGLINFFVAVLDHDSHSYIVNRLLDRTDRFGLKQVRGVFDWMVEQWSGRPTQPPSVSTPSPPTTGPSSTPPTPRPSSSDSPAIAS